MNEELPVKFPKIICTYRTHLQKNMKKTWLHGACFWRMVRCGNGWFWVRWCDFSCCKYKLVQLDPADDRRRSNVPHWKCGGYFACARYRNIPGLTFINAGIPTIFLNAEEIGYTGTELQDEINGDAQALWRVLKLFALMGLNKWVWFRNYKLWKAPFSPKIAFVSAPKSYVSSKWQTDSGWRYRFGTCIVDG